MMKKLRRTLRQVQHQAHPAPSTSSHCCQWGNFLAQGEVQPETLSIIRKIADDSTAKTKWWSPRNCCGRHIPPFGGPNNRTASVRSCEIATAPFQHALRTRAGCECVSHVLQTLTDLDELATILSADGVGAFDLISTP